MNKKKQKKNYTRDKRSPTPANETTSFVMSRIGYKNTKPEIKLRKALWHSGLKGYRIHYKKAPGKPDIAFPGKKTAIFVHGCYWHRCPHCKPSVPRNNVEFWKNKFQKNMKRDKRKEQDLINYGWKVITVWECKIKKELDEQVERIKSELKYI
ncbi:MAG: very short patch repair endonuclease [Flavobacteriales bacterium]